MCGSPGLFAAYHVLRRLLVPRHPPCAFSRLISNLECYFGWIPHTTSPGFDCQRAARGGVPRAQHLGNDVGEAQNSGGRLPRSFDRPCCRRPTRRSRKEVIQPQVPLRLPCYDFAPVTELTLGGCVLAVRPPASGPSSFHGVTGGVYKARERIHRGVADPRLLAIPTSRSRVADSDPHLDRLLAIGSPSRACDALYRPL